MISVAVAITISWLLYVWGVYTYGFEVGWPGGEWTAIAEDADGYFWLTMEGSLGSHYPIDLILGFGAMGYPWGPCSGSKGYSPSSMSKNSRASFGFVTRNPADTLAAAKIVICFSLKLQRQIQ